jgi:2-polyprenyl-3-methyl-5-hydroxy-6-metoxy-1,4-benzoquinol methylase
MNKSFDNCEICGAADWTAVYAGAIRDGSFGAYIDDGEVARCGGCRVERLAEHCCPDAAFYEGEAYRAKLGQGLNSGSHFADADHLQRFGLGLLSSNSLRGSTIADIGCSGGSFLDHVTGLADRKIAVEPSEIYHPSLAARGYEVYPYAQEAAEKLSEAVDLAVSFQVIEHVENPRAFLADIRALLKPGGRLLISTPNRNDILMNLLPDAFPSFFYRVVHRWYFDAESLSSCAREAGFDVGAVNFVHRYGMSNALAWLRDRRPSGDLRIEGITPGADLTWRAQLEASGQSDCLYMTLVPRQPS